MSGLSGNSIVGKKTANVEFSENNVENATRIEPDNMESKMLLFNGIFFSGHWANQFQSNVCATTNFEIFFLLFNLFLFQMEDNFFHTSVDTKEKAKFMKARGIFKTAELEDSKSIDIPYEV